MMERLMEAVCMEYGRRKREVRMMSGKSDKLGITSLNKYLVCGVNSQVLHNNGSQGRLGCEIRGSQG